MVIYVLFFKCLSAELTSCETNNASLSKANSNVTVKDFNKYYFDTLDLVSFFDEELCENTKPSNNG